MHLILDTLVHLGRGGEGRGGEGRGGEGRGGEGRGGEGRGGEGREGKERRGWNDNNIDFTHAGAHKKEE